MFEGSRPEASDILILLQPALRTDSQPSAPNDSANHPSYNMGNVSKEKKIDYNSNKSRQ